MTLKEWNSASSTLLYHLVMDSLVASLIVLLENIIRANDIFHMFSLCQDTPQTIFPPAISACRSTCLSTY